MKVLFVCRSNVGRSQAAAEIYNQLSKDRATSAGTLVDSPGQKLKDRVGAEPVIEAMKSHGIDMSENIRTQITEDMLQDFGRVVVMAEEETIPSWLKSSPKYEYWEVEDIKGKTVDEAIKIIKKIERLVQKLASE